MTKKKNYFQDNYNRDDRPLSKKEVFKDRERKKNRNLDNAIRSNNISRIMRSFEDDEDEY